MRNRLLQKQNGSTLNCEIIDSISEKNISKKAVFMNNQIKMLCITKKKCNFAASYVNE